MERAIRALVAWLALVGDGPCQDLASAEVAIGALENDSQLRLTPLGFHLAHMPVDVRIGNLAHPCCLAKGTHPTPAL